jgi:hypothetical protein
MQKVYPDREKYPTTIDCRHIYNTWFTELYVEPDKFVTCLILALDAYYKKSCDEQIQVGRVLSAQLSHTRWTRENTYVPPTLRVERRNNMFVRVMDHYYECFATKRGQHEQEFGMEIVSVNDMYSRDKLNPSWVGEE